MYETRSSALDMTGAEAPPEEWIYQHLFSNQATEQPFTPNSKASPSAFSAPCPSSLLHIKRLPTVPCRALITRAPGPQTNHTRLPRSGQSQNIPSPSASHTQTASLLLCLKRAPSTSTSTNTFIALSRAHRITQAEQPNATSAEPTPPPCR
jgi:hypothetical protein